MFAAAPNQADKKYERHCIGSLLDDDSIGAVSRRRPTFAERASQATAVSLAAQRQKVLGPIGCERKIAKPPNCWPRAISAHPPQSVLWKQQAQQLNASSMHPCPTCGANRAPQRLCAPHAAPASNRNDRSWDGKPIEKPERSINGKTVVNGVNLASLKFLKPAVQCFQWDNARHRDEQPNCTLWHPRSLCRYYPHCRLSAEVCGFGHPFCSREGYCRCPLNKRSLQEHHRLAPLHILEAKAYIEKRPSSNNMGRGAKAGDRYWKQNDVKP